MSHPRIRVCPFCGSHEVNIRGRAGSTCWVECWDCHATGEMLPDVPEAIAAWNRRFDDDIRAVVITDETEGR